MRSQTVLLIAIMLIGLSTSRAQLVRREVRALTVGEPTVREIAGGETHIYKIQMETGQYLHVVVDQRGIDVAISLTAPDDKKILEVDSLNGALGPEAILIIAEQAGEYRLQ